MKVSLVSSIDGDWMGMYVDGVLTDEGHSLPPWMVLESLNIDYEEFEVDFTALNIGHCDESTLEELRANRYVYQSPVSEG